MTVRRAMAADVPALAAIVAAEDRWLLTEPPVDVEAFTPARPGHHRSRLEVFPHNAAAIALYAGQGFALEGVRRDHHRRRDGTLHSTLLMAILLSSGC